MTKKIDHPLANDLNADKIPESISPFFYNFFISYFTPAVLNSMIVGLGCKKGINKFLIRLSRYLEGEKIIVFKINSSYIKFCNRHNIYLVNK